MSKRRSKSADLRRRSLTLAKPEGKPPQLVFVADSVKDYIQSEFPGLRPFMAEGKIGVDDEIAIAIGSGEENYVSPDGVLFLKVDDVPYTIAALMQFFRLVQGGMPVKDAFQGLIAALSAKETSS